MNSRNSIRTAVTIVMSRRRKAGAAVLIVALVIALSAPFLFQAPPKPPGTIPPPGDGNGGNGGGGNGAGDGGGQKDTEAPQTTISIAGPMRFLRAVVQYFYPNITIYLRATDNSNLSMIILNDTGTPTIFQVNGTSAQASLVVNATGLHQLWYYSIDKAGNRETPHSRDASIARPELIDLIDIIENSNVDNDGIKNALTAKVRAAQHQLDSGHNMNSLDALVNQLNALVGKHGLDPETVQALLDIISVLTS